MFDTTLTRACGPPEALFLWLGRRLVARSIIDTTPETFARARIRADHEVWGRAGGLDSSTTLRDFHVEVARLLGLSGQMVDKLVAEELSLEREVMRPLPRARELTAEAALRGLGVAFISDTYFDAAYVRSLLDDARMPAGRGCFVSSAYGSSKASGSLFGCASSDLDLKGKELVHGGDNPFSDVAVPRRLGIPSFWLADGRLNRYERELAAGQWATSGLSSALAGASRVARLTLPARGRRESAIRDVAAGVAGPLLIGYVLWLLQRAKELGLRRLYFVARDGQVLAQIAHLLVRRMGLRIEVHYLYVSRLSTNRAATFEATADEIGWVLRDLGEAPCEVSLQRLGLSWDDVASELDRVGVSRTEPVPDAVRDAVAAALSTARVRELVISRAAAPRETVMAYLNQEGLFETGRSGLVDVGGVGSQVRALHRLVEHAGSEPPRIFLVGLDRPEDAGLRREAQDPAWLDDTECYLYDDRRDLGMRRFRGLVTCFQMFCAADHGTVIGYERSSTGQVKASLDEGWPDEVNSWGLPLLQAAVLQVAEGMVLDADLVDTTADVRETTCGVVRSFWRSPSYDEARAWGSFPFEGAQAVDTSSTPLSHRYKPSQIVKGLANGQFPNLGWQHWYEGSLRLSPKAVRIAAGSAEHAFRRAASSQNPFVQRGIAVARRYRR